MTDRHGLGKRGHKRRQQIIEATVELVAERGTRAVTHRAVAQEADVPLAATTYYFANKEDLLAAAFEHIADLEIKSIDEGLAELPKRMSVSEAAAIAATFVSEDLRTKHAQIVAELELHLEASRRPPLLPTHRRLSDASLRFCETYVARAGSTQPETDGALLLTVLTGLMLGEVADKTPRFETDVALPLLLRLFSVFRLP